MTDIVIAKIQNRRGLLQDLPQPLDPGEFGLCTDTQQLFIGGDPTTDPTTTIRVLANGIATENTAIQIIRDYLFQVLEPKGYDPADTFDAAQAKFVAELQVQYPDANAVTTAMYLVEGSDDPSNDGWWIRGYVGYFVEQDTPPAGTISVAYATGKMFEHGHVSLSPPYVTDDAHAIVAGMNIIYSGPIGDETDTALLVTTDLNIEVLTSSTDVGTILRPSETNVFSGLTTGVSVIVPALSEYRVAESDSFIVEYSLNDPDGEAYSRVGTFTIATLAGTMAQLKDSYTSLEVTPGNLEVDFRAEIADSKLQIYLVATSAAAIPTLVLTTYTSNWKAQ